MKRTKFKMWFKTPFRMSCTNKLMLKLVIWLTRQLLITSNALSFSRKGCIHRNVSTDMMLQQLLQVLEVSWLAYNPFQALLSAS